MISASVVGGAVLPRAALLEFGTPLFAVEWVFGLSKRSSYADKALRRMFCGSAFDPANFRGQDF